MLQSQIHKRINFNFEKQKLVFDTSQGLFSFAKVDEGTKELLNSLRKNTKINYQKVLDMGCGYGTIGIFLKKKYESSSILCIDRDSLAVDFTNHNAKLNNVQIKSEASLDFEEIKEQFNLIICNFPAKLEKKGLEYFIAKSSVFLEKDGILALVIVKELEAGIQEILKNEKISLSFKEKKKSYSIYHLQFNDEIKIKTEPYITNEISFDLDGNMYSMMISEALREFDTPHFVTQLIMEKLSSKEFAKNKKIVIVNPNQGFIPLSVAHSCSREKTILVSRDLLQLKISSENLKINAINNIETINNDFFDGKSDLLIWSIIDEVDKEIIEKLKTYRKNNKQIIIAGRQAVISRVLKNMNIKSKKEIQKGKYIGVEI